jgi:hypothetical protein
MKESKFKNKLSAIEVHSVIDKLKDKEPTPAWIKQLKDVLKHYDVLMIKLGELAANSNKRNGLGRKYGRSSLANIISHYATKCHGFTKNGQKTINDHLDVLAEYLINPDSNFPEEHPIPTLRERLEKERAEGKWERVSEAMANKAKETKDRANKVANETGKSLSEAVHYVKVPENQVVIDSDDAINLVDHYKRRAKVKRIKKHKKHHKTKNIYITINIGR